MKNILVIGKNGQLSQYFCRSFEEEITVASRKDLDLREIEKIKFKLGLIKPSFIINFSSYNEVELAENSLDNYLINSMAIKEIAQYSYDEGLPLVHISTDYVFDGKKSDYLESTPPNPINEYGKAKLEGENFVRGICDDYLIIRTSWLYSSLPGRNNFFNKILNLYLSQPLKVKGVIDSIGSPTSAYTFSEALQRILPKFNKNRHLSGTYHFSNKGSISRYEFIVEIIKSLDSKFQNGLPAFEQVKSSDFLIAAPRPKNTSLNCETISSIFGIDIISWKEGLKKEIELLDII